MTLSNSVYASLKKRGRHNSLFFDFEKHPDLDIDDSAWNDASTDGCLTDFEE